MKKAATIITQGAGEINGVYPRPVALSSMEDLLAAYDTAAFEAAQDNRIIMNMWFSNGYDADGNYVEARTKGGQPVGHSPSGGETYLWIRTGLSFYTFEQYSYRKQIEANGRDLQELIAAIANQCSGVLHVAFIKDECLGYTRETLSEFQIAV